MELFKTWLVETYIAHRGIHDKQTPENSLPAFEKAKSEGYAIELDVHMIADGNIIVFHDDSLSRMTGKDGYVKNLKIEDLKTLKLLGTKFTIPTLQEILKLIDGEVPILIEIKNADKVGELESKLYEILSTYSGPFAIQSFNPFVLEWFKKNAPNIVRGQLAGFMKDSNISKFKKYALRRMLLNKKISEPHFIAYEAKHLPNRFVKKFKHLPLIAWTVTSQKDYLRVIKYSDNIIFEGFDPKI